MSLNQFYNQLYHIIRINTLIFILIIPDAFGIFFSFESGKDDVDTICHPIIHRLSISQWLLVGSIVHAFNMFLLFLVVYFYRSKMLSKKWWHQRGIYISIFTSVYTIIFDFMWSTVGLIIVTDLSKECTREFQRLRNISIIWSLITMIVALCKVPITIIHGRHVYKNTELSIINLPPDPVEAG